MRIHRTALLTAVFAAVSVNAEVSTSQVKIPIHTTVSVSSGAFFDRVVLSLPRAGTAKFAPERVGSSMGHIIYFAADTGSLMAVLFDAARLEVKGSPVTVLEGVRAWTAVFGAFEFSENGVLAYVPGGVRAIERTLVWVDRKGAEQPVGAPPRQYNLPRLSPDGGQIALSRLTFDNLNVGPLWSPDGKRLIYASGPELTRMSLVSAPSDASGPPTVLLSEASTPDAVSPDGRLVIQTSPPRVSGNTLSVVTLENSSINVKPRIINDTPFNKSDAEFSPNGRLIAYTSSESGRPSIYVQEFPGPGGKWTIADVGTQPRWARNGRELFYRSGSRMMVVDIDNVACIPRR